MPTAMPPPVPPATDATTNTRGVRSRMPAPVTLTVLSMAAASVIWVSASRTWDSTSAALSTRARRPRGRSPSVRSERGMPYSQRRSSQRSSFFDSGR